jgi:hypothetical protein
VTPSVRGRQKAKTAAALLASATLTGALTGFALGALWAGLGLPPAAPLVAAALVGLAVLADLGRRPRPFAVGRQVPQEWGRLLDPPVAATLYGARLGVGPLTILSTWLWWAAMAVAVSMGPWVGAVAGTAFGAVRAVSMLMVAQWAQSAMPARMARLRRAEPAARVLAALVAVGLVAALLLR